MKKRRYVITSNTILKQILKDNYDAVFEYLYSANKDDIYKIFDDGIDFAMSIICNNQLINEIEKSNLLTNLTFGKNELSLLYDFKVEEIKKDIHDINIENWSILIYFYFVIKKISSIYYEFPVNNNFIKMISIGQKNKNNFVEDNIIEQFVITNGFNLYYRMLMCTAIFAKGKSIDLKLLDKIDYLNIDKIKQWLKNYNTILTLNYDCIIENLLLEEIVHLHGKFHVNKKESIYNQSIGLQWSEKIYVSYSDILIGDYFINKTRAGIINSLNNNPRDRKTTNVSKLLESTLNKNGITTVVIFGMNIENDQQVLRNIMLSLIRRIDKHLRIIYCYFNEFDLRSFIEQYEKIITFNKEINELVKKINVSCINTNDILNKYFRK